MNLIKLKLEMEKILIAGSTGQTGKRVIEILNNTENFKPIAMIRKEEQKQIFDDMDVERTSQTISRLGS